MATAKFSIVRSTSQRAPTNVPHSWELKTWPREVWPHDPKRARWISRAYRKELLAEDAMTRKGKCLVFRGVPYTRWLARGAEHVVEFQSNNPAIGKSRARATATA